MAATGSRDFEVRQLLKAYRKGLISDALFEEQMRELGADGAGASAAAPPPEKVYRYNNETFASERAMVVRFLDDFRAAEAFGGEVLQRWVDVARDPLVRGGLRTICARERAHGQLLAARLRELGGECRADLPPAAKEQAQARLAASDVSDLEKLRDVVARYPDADAGVKPIREVIAQIEDDVETKTLLATILEDEIATLRWTIATCAALTAGGPAAPPAE
jgi:hypothetical protein